MKRPSDTVLVPFVYMSVLTLFVFGVVLAPHIVFAQGLVPCGNPGQGECDFGALVELIRRIIEFIVTLSVFVATGLFAWAGVLYFTAGGDTGKIDKAHKIFYSVAIGFVIILISWLVVDTILKTLTGKGIDEVGRDATGYQIDTPRNFL